MESVSYTHLDVYKRQISAKDEIAHNTVVELHDVLDGFGTEPGVFLVHLVEDVLQRCV